MDLPGGSGRQQPPLPPMTPLPLARQGSVYSLTFDEFQTTLGGAGKDFGSMNMDELLRNIWMAEESHAIAAPAATTAAAAAADHAAGAPIQRQGSLTLPRTLSQKTVDEVWRDMMCFGTPAAAASPPAQRQQTLGEITLEEFLVRAGMVREDMAAGRTVPPVPAALPPPPQPPMLFPQSNAFAPMVPPLSVGNGLMTGTVGQGGGGAATVVSQGRPDWPVTSTSNGFGKTEGGNLSSLSPQQVVSLVRPVTSNGFGKMEGGDLSSLSPPPAPYVFNGGLRGRKASAMEKVVERRQRRMIKNRESATRSRQRKQAYMMELEAEVAKLKELNEELQKKQVEMIEKQKNEVLEKITRKIGPKSKRICLRRTLTGPW